MAHVVLLGSELPVLGGVQAGASGQAHSDRFGLGGEVGRARRLSPCCPQEEYIREQIDWQEIAFADNQPCINLISLKPHGILRILDDQCCFPQVSRSGCVSLARLLSVSEPHVLIRPESGSLLCSDLAMGAQDTQPAIHNLG